MAKAIETFVTGDKELDAVLKALPAKLAKKFMRKATREAAKETLQDFRGNVDVETGALRDVAKVRAIKRSRGKVGHMIHIDREKLVLERAARGGEVGFDPKRKEPFFYAAQVELDPSGPKPLRSALYDRASKTEEKIKSGLKAMIADASTKGAA